MQAFLARISPRPSLAPNLAPATGQASGLFVRHHFWDDLRTRALLRNGIYCGNIGSMNKKLDVHTIGMPGKARTSQWLWFILQLNAGNYSHIARQLSSMKKPGAQFEDERFSNTRGLNPMSNPDSRGALCLKRVAFPSAASC